MRKAIFLDRDGAIIEEKEYAYESKDCILLPNSVKGLKLLKDFILIIATNQSGIGRKMFSIKDYQKFQKYLLKKLNDNGIIIKKSYFCPHLTEDKCDCRKPKPKFLHEAEKEFNIDLQNSYMIGDKKSDFEFGKNGNLKTIHVLTGYGRKFQNQINPDYIAKDLLDAAKWILKNENNKKH